MSRLFRSFVAAAVVLVGLSVAAPPAGAATPAPGSYVALEPTRVLDTRTGAYGNRKGPVFNKVAVRVTGSSGVPSDAAAVVLTITVLAPRFSGDLTASTFGLATRPNVTTVSFAEHERATGLALVRPTAGRIELWTSPGRKQVLADVVGYYAGGTPSADGALHLTTPKRAVRFQGSLIAPHGTLAVNLGTLAGLPDHAGAVAATVTVIGPTRSGSLVAWATGTTRPTAPLVDFTPGSPTSGPGNTVTQFGVLPVSDIQGLSLFNASPGSLHVTVDVFGWFTAGAPATPGAQQVLAANRIFRDATLPARHADAVPVLGRGGVPRTGIRAVLVSARVSGATRAGALVGGAGSLPVLASFMPGKHITGVAILRVRNGKVLLHNASAGPVALEVDVVGYVVSSAVAAPAAKSVAYYPNDLIEPANDPGLIANKNLMAAHGAADGNAGATFVLLDLGAQSVTSPLSPAHPGVAITRTSPVVRFTYPQLTTVLNSYLAALGQHSTGHNVRVALGTNNDGDWTAYRAAARGSDWAELIDGLTTPANVTVVGANDIESTFASTQAQAQSWEDAYFADTAADLVFNGALVGCSTVFGDSSPCSFGWTLQQYWNLVHHVVAGRNRTQVLPQVYFAVQAVQWANLVAHGAGGLRFVGSLTEFGADSTTFRPAQGWAALYRALQWQSATPSLPRAVDIAPAA